MISRLTVLVGVSIASRFGRYCSGSEFEHDLRMATIAGSHIGGSQQPQSSTQCTESQPQLDSSPVVMAPDLPSTPPQHGRTISSPTGGSTPRRLVSPLEEVQESRRPDTPPTTHAQMVIAVEESAGGSEQTDEGDSSWPPNRVKRCYQEVVGQEEDDDQDGLGESQQTDRSFVSTISMRHSLTRREAYYQMLENADGDGWTGISLISTGGNHTVPDKEL